MKQLNIAKAIGGEKAVEAKASATGAMGATKMSSTTAAFAPGSPAEILLFGFKDKKKNSM